MQKRGANMRPTLKQHEGPTLSQHEKPTLIQHKTNVRIYIFIQR